MGEPIVYSKAGMCVMNADGTGMNQLMDYSTNIKFFHWSPDSSKLLFIADKQSEN